MIWMLGLDGCFFPIWFAFAILRLVLSCLKAILLDPEAAYETWTCWTMSPASTADRRFGGVNWSEDLTTQIKYIELQHSVYGRAKLKALMRLNHHSMWYWITNEMFHVADSVRRQYYPDTIDQKECLEPADAQTGTPVSSKTPS